MARLGLKTTPVINGVRNKFINIAQLMEAAAEDFRAPSTPVTEYKMYLFFRILIIKYLNCSNLWHNQKLVGID